MTALLLRIQSEPVEPVQQALILLPPSMKADPRLADRLNQLPLIGDIEKGKGE